MHTGERRIIAANINKLTIKGNINCHENTHWENTLSMQPMWPCFVIYENFFKHLRIRNGEIPCSLEYMISSVTKGYS